MFKGYGKIHHLSKDESQGILFGTVYVQEKIDGANLSVWMEDGEIHVGSRTQDVTLQEGGFRGAVPYIKNHKGINDFLKACPNFRLYGEWLVPHTITNYNPEAYNHFYLFDIEDENGERMCLAEVDDYANIYGIRKPEILNTFENPTMEEVLKYVGKSTIGPNGEGIVIKNPDFVNRFGDKTYAKVVGEEFHEQNEIMFGNHKRGDNEGKCCHKYATGERVRKIINKIEQNEGKDIEKSDIPKIIGMAYHDIITEEAWDIQKMGVIDFNRMKGIMMKRLARIALDIIDGNAESIVLNHETHRMEKMKLREETDEEKYAEWLEEKTQRERNESFEEEEKEITEETSTGEEITSDTDINVTAKPEFPFIEIVTVGKEVEQIEMKGDCLIFQEGKDDEKI